MYIKVRAFTKSKEEKVVKKTEDSFVIYIKEKPEMNMANTRILAILRDLFKTNNIRLVSGHHSPSKIFSVD